MPTPVLLLLLLLLLPSSHSTCLPDSSSPQAATHLQRAWTFDSDEDGELDGLALRFNATLRPITRAQALLRATSSRWNLTRDVLAPWRFASSTTFLRLDFVEDLTDSLRAGDIVDWQATSDEVAVAWQLVRVSHATGEVVGEETDPSVRFDVLNTAATFELTYSSDSGDGPALLDADSRAVASFRACATLDRTGPRFVSAETLDVDADGTLDHIRLTLSESFDLASARKAVPSFLVSDGYTAVAVNESMSRPDVNGAAKLVLVLASSGVPDTGVRPLFDSSITGFRVEDKAGNFLDDFPPFPVLDGAPAVLLDAIGRIGSAQIDLLLSEDVFAGVLEPSLIAPFSVPSGATLTSVEYAPSPSGGPGSDNAHLILTMSAPLQDVDFTQEAQAVERIGLADGVFTDVSGNVARADKQRLVNGDVTAPQLVRATSVDSNNDGITDLLDLEFSEPVRDSTFDFSRWQVTGMDLASAVPAGTTVGPSGDEEHLGDITFQVLSMHTGDTADDERVRLAVFIDFPVQVQSPLATIYGTRSALVLSCASACVDDISDNEAANVRVNVTDGIIPRIIDAYTVDVNSNGYIDLVRLTFSEAMDAQIRNVALQAFSVQDYTIVRASIPGGLDSDVVFLSLQEANTERDEDGQLIALEKLPDTGAQPLVMFDSSVASALQPRDVSGNALMPLAEMWTVSDRALPTIVSAQSYVGDNTLVIKFSEPVFAAGGDNDGGHLQVDDLEFQDGPETEGATSFGSVQDGDGSDRLVRFTASKSFHKTDFDADEGDAVVPAENSVRDANGNVAHTFPPRRFEINDDLRPAEPSVFDPASSAFLQTMGTLFVFFCLFMWCAYKCIMRCKRERRHKQRKERWRQHYGEAVPPPDSEELSNMSDRSFEDGPNSDDDGGATSARGSSGTSGGTGTYADLATGGRRSSWRDSVNGDDETLDELEPNFIDVPGTFSRGPHNASDPQAPRHTWIHTMQQILLDGGGEDATAQGTPALGRVRKGKSQRPALDHPSTSEVSASAMRARDRELSDLREQDEDEYKDEEQQ